MQTAELGAPEAGGGCRGAVVVLALVVLALVVLAPVVLALVVTEDYRGRTPCPLN